jgi:predicted DNA-binding transcriptional regulator AlpA
MPALPGSIVSPGLLSKARKAADRLRRPAATKRHKAATLGLASDAEDIQALVALVDALSEQAKSGREFVIDEEMTANEAAVVLGMSRPSIMRLVAKGELHPRMVHSRHKFARVEIDALARKQTKDRRAALANLTALTEECDF